MGAAWLAWRQLVRERLRLVVALAGVAFAVVLMFMQLGFRTRCSRAPSGFTPTWRGTCF